jgi:hypothetical protein
MNSKEEAMKTLIEFMKIPNIMDLQHHNIINLFGKLEQYINQEQHEQDMKRIKELEAYVSILLEDAVTPQIDELKIDLEEANDKLNAISEMLESDNPISYRLAMARKILRGDNDE